MSYSSIRGRKPIERANKISHGSIIANPVVQDFLSTCTIPQAADPSIIKPLLQQLGSSSQEMIRAIVAVDGSMREISIQDDFPSASVTFFTFGPLLFHLDSLKELDKETFISPQDLAKLKKIQRFSLALPTRNIASADLGLRDFLRLSLHRFFCEHEQGDEPFYKTLRWLLFRQWQKNDTKNWTLPSCPNYQCQERNIVITPDFANQEPCKGCGKPIYLIDAARLHERIDDDQGAGPVSSYILSLLEQISLVHVIRMIWNMKPSLLQEILFIKDGPLACFGQIAPLSKPLREMASFLGNQIDPIDPSRQVSLLNLLGLEKSGPFVEHAIQIDKNILPGSVLILSNDYIYRYIVPANPKEVDPYGFNTYWGEKLIFKAYDSNLYVATIPTAKGFDPSPKYEDFLNLSEVLNIVSELRCSMYDNALIPIALSNRLISLSEVPSSRILEAFAKENTPRPAKFDQGKLSN